MIFNTLLCYFADTEFLIECLGFCTSCAILTYATVVYGMPGLQGMIADLLLGYNKSSTAIAREKSQYAQNTKLLATAEGDYEGWKSDHAKTMRTLSKTLARLSKVSTTNFDLEAIQIAKVCEVVTSKACKLKQSPTSKDLAAISTCL